MATTGKIDFRPCFEEIKAAVRHVVRRTFDSAVAPDGSAFRALSPVTRKMRLFDLGGDLPLRDSERLLRSLLSDGDPYYYEKATGSALAMGTKAKDERGRSYPKFHMTGTRKMPQRKFLGFNAEIRKTIKQAVKRRAIDVLKGRA